jgi:hypothetical protein
MLGFGAPNKDPDLRLGAASKDPELLSHRLWLHAQAVVVDVAFSGNRMTLAEVYQSVRMNVERQFW